MKTLFIFDSSFIKERTGGLRLLPEDSVLLFPITSQTSITEHINNNIRSKVLDVLICDTARLVNTSSEDIRGKFIKFIAELPNKIKQKGHNLKEIFSIDKYATLWWFSLIAEKNPFKSDSFNRLTQLDAIIKTINKEKIEKIIVSCRSKRLVIAIKDFAQNNKIKLYALPTNQTNNIKIRIKEFQGLFYAKHILNLFTVFLRILIIKIKLYIKLFKTNKHKQDKTDIVIITPFPGFDINLAKKGIYRNKFYIYLQDQLESNKKNIFWLTMYVDENSLPFNEAMGYTNSFIKNDCNILFFDQFNSFYSQIKSLLKIILRGFKFISLEKEIRNLHCFDSYNFYPLFRDDWFSSFVGSTGYLGIVYYQTFKRFFKNIESDKCLYLCEMHAWEKALIAAKQAAKPELSLFAYQSGTVSKMLLNYFNDSVEINNNTAYPMPRPNMAICNGPLSFEYFIESGWSKNDLAIAEAIRYDYLKKYLYAKPHLRKNVIGITLSISHEESSSLLNMVYEALNNLENDAEVWIRPHPFMDTNRLFENTNLPKENTIFKFDNGNLEEFLKKVKVVVGGESGVTVEAIALGCPVIIVNSPEWINMSPLRFINTGLVKIVNSAIELRQIIEETIKAEPNSDINNHEAKRIINNFFYLNYDTDIPVKFMNLLNV